MTEEQTDDSSAEQQEGEGARDAATVIVLREQEEDFEVFMVRRHGATEFLANRYVYPGGQLDPEDCTEDAAEHVEGLTPEEARERLDEEIDPYKALGLFLAGVRETFEESGLLLARRAGSEKFIDLTSDPDVSDRFSDYRKKLHENEISLSEVAERENLVIPLQWLGYFAHWITPFIESKRYDTRFFVAIAPANQEPLHDRRETTEGLWITPEDALERSKTEDFLLAPPTLRTLQQLAEFQTASDALEFAQSHIPPTLLPHMDIEGTDVVLLLPGDPDYPADEERYAISEEVEGEVTRMVMEKPGRWHVV